MFTAQLICQSACRQVDIVRTFGVSKQSVIRSVNKYRAGGVKAFYTPRATRGAAVMTPEVTAQAEQLLGAGWSRREVAEHLGLKLDTLRKAFQQGRLTEPGPLEPGATAPDQAAAHQPPMATDRSTRAVEDAAAEMGTACTRPDQRSPGGIRSSGWSPDPFRALPRRLLWRRALRLAGPGGEWPVSTSPRLPCSVARLLQHAARDRPVGPHGAVPHQGRRAVAVPTPG